VAVGAVALAAGGGDGGSTGSGSTGGSGASTNPGGGSSTPAATLTGRWMGSADRGDGITGVTSGQGLSCTSRADLTVDLVQTGSTLSGTGTSTTRGVDCSVPLPAEVAAVIGQAGSGTLSGSASGGTLTFQAGLFTFNGTYTSTRIEASANMPIEGLAFAITIRLNRQ
jgi:hypothetical protein